MPFEIVDKCRERKEGERDDKPRGRKEIKGRKRSFSPSHEKTKEGEGKDKRKKVTSPSTEEEGTPNTPFSLSPLQGGGVGRGGKGLSSLSARGGNSREHSPPRKKVWSFSEEDNRPSLCESGCQPSKGKEGASLSTARGAGDRRVFPARGRAEEVFPLPFSFRPKEWQQRGNTRMDTT